ncbi:hypothetical protein BKA93DRAFT_95264 [Sparassis latifolia]
MAGLRVTCFILRVNITRRIPEVLVILLKITRRTGECRPSDLTGDFHIHSASSKGMPVFLQVTRGCIYEPMLARRSVHKITLVGPSPASFSWCVLLLCYRTYTRSALRVRSFSLCRLMSSDHLGTVASRNHVRPSRPAITPTYVRARTDTASQAPPALHVPYHKTNDMQNLPYVTRP